MLIIKIILRSPGWTIFMQQDDSSTTPCFRCKLADYPYITPLNYVACAKWRVTMSFNSFSLCVIQISRNPPPLPGKSGDITFVMSPLFSVGTSLFLEREGGGTPQIWITHYMINIGQIMLNTIPNDSKLDAESKNHNREPREDNF